MVGETMRKACCWKSHWGHWSQSREGICVKLREAARGRGLGHKAMAVVCVPSRIKVPRVCCTFWARGETDSHRAMRGKVCWLAAIFDANLHSQRGESNRHLVWLCFPPLCKRILKGKVIWAQQYLRCNSPQMTGKFALCFGKILRSDGSVWQN